jgi:hypothetical protein
MPQKGTTLAQEMECYSLPFGALGFASHIFTYYTIIVLAMGRCPLRPWKLLACSWFDMCLSFIGLVGGSAIAVFTLVRCRDHWQLFVIAIWKLSMSVFNGVVGFHIATIVRRFSKEQRSQDGLSAYLRLRRWDDDRMASGKSTSGEGEVVRPATERVLIWGVLCKFSSDSFEMQEPNDDLTKTDFPGMFAGFIGLISLIIRNWDDHPALHIIVFVFSGVFGFTLVISTVTFFFGEGSVLSFPITPLMFIMLSALFCDWSLGAMTDNLLGTPSGDSAGLYWSYFIFKRFTMFSL